VGRSILLAVIGMPACGSPPPPGTAAAGTTGSADDVARLLPLPDKTVYTFATRSEGTTDNGILVIEVARLSESLVQLKSGARRQLLEIRPEGVQHASGGFLLKRPLQLGAEFKGEFGRVRITRVEVSVTVPAGRFTGCLETVEERSQGPLSQSSTKLFCPEVGIVSLHTEAESGNQSMSDWAELKSTAKRVEF
jgi:hypothetical protein